MVADFAKGTHSDVGFVVYDRPFDGAVFLAFPHVPTRAKESLHRIVQSREGGAKEVAVFNRF
jgi:hypothetical protein